MEKPSECGLNSLQGKQILLRPFVEADITETYLDWLEDKELMRFSEQRFYEHTAATALQYAQTLREEGGLFLAIVESSTGVMVGTITARISPHHRIADLGILVGSAQWRGLGVGFEAWGLLMNHLFSRVEIRKATAGTLRANRAMRRIAEKSGMHLEGVRKKQEWFEGEAMDVMMYAKFSTHG